MLYSESVKCKKCREEITVKLEGVLCIGKKYEFECPVCFTKHLREEVTDINGLFTHERICSTNPETFYRKKSKQEI